MSGSGSRPPGEHIRVPLSGRRLASALIRPALAGCVLLVGYFLLPLDHTSDFKMIGFVVDALLLIAFCGWEIRHFIRSPYPIATALEMLAALATFYIVAFATTYFLISEYGADGFNMRLTRIDALYFSLTVFTTTGFGDIAPASQAARVVVSVQMASAFVMIALGIHFLTLLISARRNTVD
ncbi:potassium channel family protein [Gordonia otitidis]|uniref:potassium channel family protein n=1 Tax=Gordonia otitidis TaxID=249058 RepID=UPI001D14ACDD|nr:potassium channel family protein [Gordonia otitidis]UEA61268.1 potassium channel family protein [Gordonia otitidis]